MGDKGEICLVRRGRKRSKKLLAFTEGLLETKGETTGTWEDSWCLNGNCQ